MSDATENSYEFRFGIIEFRSNAQKEDELLPIDLVPGSWLKKVKDNYYCKYPPKKEFEYVGKWTNQERSPEKRWKSYPVTLIHSAADFAQGRRRLERAFQTRDCASTDCESQKNSDMPEVMSNCDVRELLHTKLPMNIKQTRNNTELLLQKQKLKPQRDVFEENAPENLQKINKSSTLLASKLRSSRNSCYESSDSDGSIYEPRSLARNKNHKNGNAAGDQPTNNRSQKPNSVQSDWDEGNSESSHSEAIGETTKNTPEKVSPTHQSNTNKVELLDAITQIMSDKIRELEVSVHRSIQSSKRSVLYNIEHKMEELKLAIVASNIPRVPKGTIHELFEAVKTPLPITTLEAFLEFDKAVNEEPEKKDALIALFQYLCFEYATAQKCIDNVLPKIFTKSVQGKYSGQGKLKGVSKLNFSITATFTCFEAAILAKFGQCDETKALKSKIGIWLTHFADREGCRKLRETDQVQPTIN